MKSTPTSIVQSLFSDISLDIPPAALNSPVVGQLPDDTVMNVRLMFKIQGQSGQSGTNKTTAGQGQDLEKLANQIGISDATYQQIKAVLGVQGVTLSLSKLHTDLKMDAKARMIGALFQTQFSIHKYNGRTFFAPATTPKLPTFIVNNLLAVSGLDSYSAQLHTGFSGVVHSLGSTAFSGHTKASCNSLPPSNEVYPRSVASAYGFNAYYQHNWHGEGMTINLVEIDGVTASDVAFYQQCVGYQGHITVKDIDSAPSQASGESVLDIEMIEGLDRNVNIVDYETGTPSAVNVEDELQQIVDDNTKNTAAGSVVSISLGAAENLSTFNDIKATDQLLYLLTQKEHMTVFVATGDCAAFADGVFNSLSVNFPASDPNVVAVGGTVLQVNSNGNRAGETVWSDPTNQTQCNNAWGSGGGNSNFFQLPSWQSGKGL